MKNKEETKEVLKEEPILEKEEPIVEEPIVEEIVEATPEETTEEIKGIKRRESEWVPKTELGKKVVSGEIVDMDQALNSHYKLLEYQVVDKLLPNLECVLLNVGQSKGKFGGGKRSIWKQTQKKTKEGNRIKFAALAIVGNKDGYAGVGFAKSKETVPAREKAIRLAKLNLIKVSRGCGSWACDCGENHSIKVKTEGKCGSVKILLKPAPKGSGLLVEKESKRLLEIAGIKDIYSKTFGSTNTKLNMVKACFYALKNLSKFKFQNSLEENKQQK